MTREEMGKLVFAKVAPLDEWDSATFAVRERCMLAAEAVDRASRRDERRVVGEMLRSNAGRRREAYLRSRLDYDRLTSEGVLVAAELVEARNAEGVE